MDTLRIEILKSKYPISYYIKYVYSFFFFFFFFAIYRSKVNTSSKNKIFFENICFPQNLVNGVQKDLKTIQTECRWDRIKSNHFIEVSNIP